MMLLLMIALLAPASVSAQAEGCSSGDTEYMCKNLNICWTALGFASADDLKYLCEIQGYSYDEEGSGEQEEAFVVITTPPSNLTVAEGAAAAFRCSADFAVRIVIAKNSDLNRERLQDTPGSGNPTQQTTIQEIDAAMIEHEGWYTCTAYGVGGTSVSAEAYLEIRDICANSNCEDPKVCSPDKYTGNYECVCPGDCSAEFEPVCGSDCASYFNECTMKKETCEKGLTGVTVASTGLCDFSPAAPELTNSPSDAEYKKGAQFSLSAAASGTPAPSFMWFANGVQVGEGKDFAATMSADYQGNWMVKAANCHGSYETSASFTLGMSQDEQDLTPPEDQCCKVYGDPHILTFDGKSYDYMGIGTFVIAQHNDGLWTVFGTFEACGDKTKQLSCVTSITVFYEYEKVQFLRMWRINNNGNEFMVPLGASKNIGGMRIDNKDLTYIITLGDTGVKVKWDGIVTSQVCVSKCAGNTGGLCANANCDAGDEFLGRGFMNPYTGSWAAASSSEYGNSWAIDPSKATLEPEDGALPISRQRPCDVVPAAERQSIESRCNTILQLADFQMIAGGNVVDTQVMLANCYFDGCAGLVFGAGCKNSGDAACPADIEALIAAAIAAGMTMEEAIAKYGGRGLDSACMMGLGMARELERWGVNVGTSWRTQVSPPCPTDQEIAEMRICPT